MILEILLFVRLLEDIFGGFFYMASFIFDYIYISKYFCKMHLISR